MAEQSSAVSSAISCDSSIVTSLGAALLILAGGLSSGRAQPAAADPRQGEQEAAPIRVVVNDVRMQGIPTSNLMRADLTLTLTVTNQSEEPLNVIYSDFTLLANGKKPQRQSPSDRGLTPQPKPLAPGESRKGSITFGHQLDPQKEPTLRLEWRSGEETLNWDMNRMLRELWDIKVERIGPDSCLAVATCSKPLSSLTIWLLEERLQVIKNQEIERLVLVFDVSEKPSTSNSYSLRLSHGTWLNSILAGPVRRRFPFGMQLQSSVQFSTFYVVNAQAGQLRTYPGQSSDIQRPTRERAVADALKSVYLGISIEQALRDLDSPEPGVRTVAVEANIDRLTQSQLTHLVDKAAVGPVETLELVVKNLHRVPYTSVTDTLMTFTAHENQAVSTAAITSLVRSVADNSVLRIRETWHRSKDERIRSEIIQTILATKDYRYFDVVSEHAIELLDHYCRSEKATESAEGKPADNPKVLTATHFKRVLEFLADEDNSTFVTLARSRLLEVEDVATQDVVMKHLLRTLDADDEAFARQYIAQRLGLDTEGQASRKSYDADRMVSTEVLATIRKFPSPDYAARLFELFSDKQLKRSVNSEAFSVALSCASRDEIDPLIEKFSQLDHTTRMHLLRYMGTLEHPGWSVVVRQALASDESTQQLALSIMRSHGSVESIELMNSLLEEIRLRTEKEQELTPADQRLVARLMHNLASVTHPDTLRIINLCNRSSVEALAAAASECIKKSSAEFFRVTPLLEELQNTYTKRTEGDYEGAIAGFNVILENEPFFASGFVSRGSLYMRQGRHKLAMEDLQRANALSPRNAITESIIAIAWIRVGEVAKGLDVAEQLLNDVPDIETLLRRDTIYNAACTYARAAETTDDREVKEKYKTRAIELLKDSIDRAGGFDDLAHLLDDRDLNALHEHDDWKALVEKVRRNEEKAAARG